MNDFNATYEAKYSRLAELSRKLKLSPQEQKEGDKIHAELILMNQELIHSVSIPIIKTKQHETKKEV